MTTDMEEYEREPLDSFSLKRSPLVLLLLIVGVAVRFFVVGYFEDSPLTDAEKIYTQVGDNWVGTYGLSLDGQPIAAVMPAYPILLGLQKWLYSDSWQPIIWLQIVLGALSAWLGARIAWKVYRQPVAFWAAFLILLLHPAFCAMCGKIEPLCIATFLFLLGVWFLTFVFLPSFHLFYFLMVAGIFSFALYFSLKILVIVPLLALGIGFLAYERMVGVLGGITVCLALLVALMPWMGRNLIVMGTFIPLTTSLPGQIETALVNRNEPSAGQIKISSGKGELDDYQRSLDRIPEEIKRVGVGDWFGTLAGAFTSWWSDYPVLFQKLHTGSNILVRTVLFTLGITLFFLALIGILPNLNMGQTWVFLIALCAFGFQISFLASPPYYHLLGFPLLILFTARGVSQIAVLFTKNWRSTEPESGPPKLTWKSETEYEYEDPYLEPIKGPQKVFGDSEEEDSKPGPLF
ncbi:MAG: hypothetical protein KC944_13770 [Candidatus Omnitrophica bacterium]|nr:hypothetical protein [Candidatus Omnitrophota bacterium]